MYRIGRMASLCVLLTLWAAFAAKAQNNPEVPAAPGANQAVFGLGSSGGPTPRRQAVSQAATRAVAVCSGVWNGERILPEGWTQFVSTPAPVQPEGNGARYGGQFWLYGGMDGLPNEAYSPSGGQGQYAMIIPSRRIVIVRRGFDS